MLCEKYPECKYHYKVKTMRGIARNYYKLRDFYDRNLEGIQGSSELRVDFERAYESLTSEEKLIVFPHERWYNPKPNEVKIKREDVLRKMVAYLNGEKLN